MSCSREPSGLTRMEAVQGVASETAHMLLHACAGAQIFAQCHQRRPHVVRLGFRVACQLVLASSRLLFVQAFLIAASARFTHFRFLQSGVLLLSPLALFVEFEESATGCLLLETTDQARIRLYRRGWRAADGAKKSQFLEHQRCPLVLNEPMHSLHQSPCL